MTLVELVSHLKSIEKAKELAAKELPDAEYDVVDLFMAGQLGLTNVQQYYK